MKNKNLFYLQNIILIIYILNNLTTKNITLSILWLINV